MFVCFNWWPIIYPTVKGSFILGLIPVQPRFVHSTVILDSSLNGLRPTLLLYSGYSYVHAVWPSQQSSTQPLFKSVGLPFIITRTSTQAVTCGHPCDTSDIGKWTHALPIEHASDVLNMMFTPMMWYLPADLWADRLHHHILQHLVLLLLFAQGKRAHIYSLHLSDLTSALIRANGTPSSACSASLDIYLLISWSMVPPSWSVSRSATPPHLAVLSIAVTFCAR